MDMHAPSDSLLYDSGKSNKSALDRERVDKLIELIEEKFKDDDKFQKEWDIKLFTAKANQKCCNCKRKSKQS